MTPNGNFNPSATVRPIVTPILNVTTETPKTKVFTISAPNIAKEAVPGQFMMVWVPGIDEIPMSISSVNHGVEFAAARVGDATTQLHELKKGDLIGVRGPLGTGFEFPKAPGEKTMLLVAGGCGSPPIVFASAVAIRMGFMLDVALGATRKAELLFFNRFKQLKTQGLRRLVVATNDGSEGLLGTAVDAATFLLDTDPAYSICLACGPEGMLVNLYKLMQKFAIPLQVSLERYMKCGVGLCGHCIIDMDGRRVCVEGPVFDANRLEKSDFGKFTRDATGKKQPVQLE
jgi:dihydroorotate dehydrogenase electron transfer subunit